MSVQATRLKTHPSARVAALVSGRTSRAASVEQLIAAGMGAATAATDVGTATNIRAAIFRTHHRPSWCFLGLARWRTDNNTNTAQAICMRLNIFRDSRCRRWLVIMACDSDHRHTRTIPSTGKTTDAACYDVGSCRNCMTVKTSPDQSSTAGLCVLPGTVLASDTPPTRFDEAPKIIALSVNEAARDEILASGNSGFVYKGNPPMGLLDAIRKSGARGQDGT